MIGVADLRNPETVSEFFELFKTAWEPAVRGRRYEVVVSDRDDLDGFVADTFVIYSTLELSIDVQKRVRSTPAAAGIAVARDTAIPIYGTIRTFSAGSGLVTLDGAPVDYAWREGSRTCWRLGYDLFAEIQYLLTEGQPRAHASSPTLERHVEVLREVLRRSGVPFAEILPRPLGFDFTCCLTHDVDFFGLRRHRFDRTLAGFVARASIGTLRDLARGRRTTAEAARNLKTCAALPFILSGLARDPWAPFDDYSAVEAPRRSTFFLVPFKGEPGAALDGAVDPLRAVPYQMSDIAAAASEAASRGSELAVHGLDAWRDSSAGRRELAELTNITQRRTAGVRMHWLYFDRRSGVRLEEAGFDYDSTWGYNDAVGHRAGTLQPFRLAGTETLLELPLAIMDSALFSAKRLRLDAQTAAAFCDPIVVNARDTGGALVINWHERSLAPERLWGRFYRQLLDRIQHGNRVWFATAGEAVNWFRWRRTARFAATAGQLIVSAESTCSPGACIRVHRQTVHGVRVDDLPFDGHTPVRLDLPCRSSLDAGASARTIRQLIH
jgi:hypothetical protein